MACHPEERVQPLPWAPDAANAHLYNCERLGRDVPPRPTGIERNVVVSQWDWGFPESFVHDLISTDKRNPTLYPYAKVYGVDRTGGGRLLVLDPVKNTTTSLQVEPRDKSHGYSLTKDY